jgi:S-(hydroxymethyl)glutathione dehydrogenase/alcohol dehydrogenase
MRAAVLRQIPGTLVVENDIFVDAPGHQEVLVQTAAAGLCHSDLHYLEGTFSCKTPVVLGHESAGIVESVGAEVTYVKPGDHVVTCLSVFCGSCEYCLTGRPALCADRNSVRRPPGATPRLSKDDVPISQFFDLSSFAEQMLIHEHALVKVDPAMPLDFAALLGCAVTTGLGAVFNTAHIPSGSSVAVLGCGGIGLSAVQGALLAGASRVIAIDVMPEKLKAAKLLGATDVLDAAEGDTVAQVIELTRGGVEYSFEAIGSKNVTEQAFRMLRRGGTCTVIGMIPPHEKVEISGIDLLMEKTLQGSTMGSNRFRIDMPRYVELYLQGRLKLDQMVSRRIRLEEIHDGFQAMKSGGIRSVVVF